VTLNTNISYLLRNLRKWILRWKNVENRYRSPSAAFPLLRTRRLHYIEGFLKEGVSVLRVMPNTAMSVGIGVFAIPAGRYASQQDTKVVKELLRASRETTVADGALQDAVTATSRTSPAHFLGSSKQ
jgi:hypothetical protein